jgi:hypothetical protein
MMSWKRRLLPGARPGLGDGDGVSRDRSAQNQGDCSRTLADLSFFECSENVHQEFFSEACTVAPVIQKSLNES